MRSWLEITLLEAALSPSLGHAQSGAADSPTQSSAKFAPKPADQRSEAH